MYLVDTNVISAAAPTKARPVQPVVDWMEQNSTVLYMSAITVMEIEAGIEKAERLGSGRKAALLTAWLDAVLHLYGDRVLPFDPAAARCAGRLSDLARGRGLEPGLADLAIAGIAVDRGLVVLTRNLRHFASIDVPSIDPFARHPS